MSEASQKFRVAQARGRKKRRIMKRLDKINEQMEQYAKELREEIIKPTYTFVVPTGEEPN